MSAPSPAAESIPVRDSPCAANVERLALLRLVQGGDPAAAEQMVLENGGLIWSIARRFFGRGVDPEDLYQLGCVGFIKAMQGFDLEYGTQFSTYAVPKIAGEIRRFLRDDGTIKVSRTLKERAGAIYSAKAALAQQNGGEPTLSELAAATGLTVEEIATAETAVQGPQSLHQPIGEDGFTLEQILSDDGQEERLVEHVALREAVDKLEKQEQMVLKLRYWKGLTQVQTAKVLNVSQVQVSRLERRAVETLKQSMAG